MCALFGWLDYRGIVSDKLLKKLTQALANAAEERGTDASGIAYVKGGKVTIYKRPKPAHKLRFNAPNNTRAVMGHTGQRKVQLQQSSVLWPCRCGLCLCP